MLPNFVLTTELNEKEVVSESDLPSRKQKFPSYSIQYSRINTSTNDFFALVPVSPVTAKKTHFFLSV